MIGRMLVAALLVAAWAWPVSAQLTPDAEKALYEAAKAEGSVTWYVAHYSTETAEKFGRAFTEKYPGVKVNVVRATAGVVFQRAFGTVGVGAHHLGTHGLQRHAMGEMVRRLGVGRESRRSPWRSAICSFSGRPCSAGRRTPVASMRSST